MSRRRRIALLGVVLVQLAVPLALAGIAAADLAFGREIRLRARPVDPLDVFRGNYVVLRYDISTVTVPADVSRGERLCVSLSESDGVWTGRYGLPERPGGGTAICGRARSDAGPGQSVGVEYGIRGGFKGHGFAETTIRRARLEECSCPKTRISPAVTRMRLQTALISVVLPAPFGPSRPKNSPSGTTRWRSSSSRSTSASS